MATAEIEKLYHNVKYFETMNYEDLIKEYECCDEAKTAVIDYLASAHPCVTALIVLKLAAYADKYETALQITNLLVDRKISANERDMY